MSDLDEATSRYKQARERYGAAVAKWDEFVPNDEEKIKTVTNLAAFQLAYDNLVAAESELSSARQRLAETMRER